METENAILAIEQTSTDTEFVTWLTGLKPIDKATMKMRQEVLDVILKTENAPAQINAPKIAEEIAILMEIMERSKMIAASIRHIRPPHEVWPS